MHACLFEIGVKRDGRKAAEEGQQLGDGSVPFFFCLFFLNYTVPVTLSSSFPAIFEAVLVTVAVPVKFSISIQHIQYGV